MEAINNETARAILQLIGPAGVGLLFYCAACTYAMNILFKELTKSRGELKDLSDKQIAVQSELKNAIDKLVEQFK